MTRNDQNNDMIADIVHSISTPGYTAKSIVRLMFYSFYALFATLMGLVIATGFNGHVIALLLLSMCLFIMIRWFISELDRVKSQDESKTKTK